MSVNTRLSITALLVFVSGLATCLHAASASVEETKIQGEFKKAYASPDATARKSALSMLAGQKHPTSWQLLATAAATDREKEVRIEAFSLLCAAPARDTSAAHMIATAFTANRSNDRIAWETELTLAEPMAKSEFKAEIINALVEMGSMMHYPEAVFYSTQNGGGGPSQRAMDEAHKKRKAFDTYLKILNDMAGTSFSPAFKTPAEIKKWWPNNAATYVQADKVLAEKYRLEDAAAAKEAAAKK